MNGTPFSDAPIGIRRANHHFVVCMLTLLLFFFAVPARGLTISAGPPTNQPSDPIGVLGFFGTEDDRVIIDFDPTAGPILKVVVTGDVNGDGAVSIDDVNTIRVNNAWTTTLHEHLEIGPNSPPWTDWHEEILSDEWDWGPAIVDIIGIDEADVNLQIMHMGPGLWMTFDPLPPGTQIDIWKLLVFTGDLDLETVSVEDVLNGRVDVLEYPTIPEPSTAALAILGLSGVVALRRRWR